MANWSDAEVRELLALRADEQIARRFTGTVKDSHLLEQLAKRLVERGFNRNKKQVTSKLKVLKKKFHEVNEDSKRSGGFGCDWPYFELCSAIWGSGHSANPVTFQITNLKEEEESPETSLPPADEPAAAAAAVAAAEIQIETVDGCEDTKAEEEKGQMKTSPPPPPRRKRRRTQRQDAMEELREFIRVEKVEAERERQRLEQQRAADEEWQRQTVLYRQQQMEAISRTQQLIERHMAMMRRFQRTHRGGIVG